MPSYFTGTRYMLRVNEGGVEKTRRIKRNDELPENAVQADVDRLALLGFVSDTPWSMPSAEDVQDAAEARLAIQRSASVEPGTAVGAMSEAELVSWIENDKPTVDAIVAAVGSDADLAGRVLAAENTATGGDPRKTLVDQLEKVSAA